MPRPKEKKRRRENNRRRWLNEFGEFKRRFESGDEKKQEKTKDDETESE